MLRDVSRGEQCLITDKLTNLIDVGFADVRDDPVIVPRRKSRRDVVVVRTPWRRAHFSVRHATYALTGSPDDPPSVLPCELIMNAELGTLWPSLGEREAMRVLVRTAEVQYGYIHVGADRDRATSEQLLAVLYDPGAGKPAWMPEIFHMAQYRRAFGARVRGAYWGNFLPTHIVDQIGGLRSLVATGASIV
jgi:hypothetical protein